MPKPAQADGPGLLNGYRTWRARISYLQIAAKTQGSGKMVARVTRASQMRGSFLCCIQVNARDLTRHCLKPSDRLENIKSVDDKSVDDKEKPS